MKRILLFLLMLAPFLSFAQEGPKSYEFSLKQAVDYAFVNQSRVLNSQLDEDIARAKVKEIAGIGLPQVNASFDVKDYLLLPTSLFPSDAFGGPKGTYVPVKFGLKYNATAGVDVSQLLFDGSYIVGLQSTLVYMDLAKKATERSKIETSIAVSKAYYNVLINEERIKLLDANVERLKKLYDDTKALNENGFVEKIDVDRVSLNFNNVQVEREKVRRFLGLSYYLLKYQIGMEINADLKLSDKLSDSDFESLQLSDAPFDYTKRIEYSLLQGQYKMNKLELRKNRFLYLPTVVAYGSFASQAQRDNFDVFAFGKNWYGVQLIGGKITLPIFDGLQKNYKIRQSKLAVAKAENDLKNLMQSIEVDLRSATVTLQNSISSLKVQRENMKLAEEVYRVSKLKYDQGVGSNLEVVNAEALLKEAQTNYYSALYDAYVAKIEMNRASGTIKFQ